VILIAFIIAVRWGIAAVAFAYVISNFVVIAPLHFRLTLRLTALNARKYFSQLGVALAGSTLMVAAIGALKYVLPTWQSHYGQLFVYLTAGMAVYIVTSRLMWPSLFTQLEPSAWRRR